MRRYIYSRRLLFGSYEVRMAQVFDKFGWNWLAHGEFDAFPYGESHTYMPDFWLPELSLYIDVKCWFKLNDQSKIARVREDNPQLALLVVTKPILKAFEQAAGLDASIAVEPIRLLRCP